MDNGKNNIRSVVDVEIPKEYCTYELRYDHCNSNRHRNSTYIIQNTDTGEFKQVESTCTRSRLGRCRCYNQMLYLR